MNCDFQSYEETKSVIIRRLSGDDDDGIQMDQLKISLLCPVSKKRLYMIHEIFLQFENCKNVVI